jgi:hypothetical protein
MASATAPGPFTLVYLVYNTISNLLTQSEQVACFRNAARHLTPGGRFVIELWVPELRSLPPGQQATVDSRWRAGMRTGQVRSSPRSRLRTCRSTGFRTRSYELHCTRGVWSYHKITTLMAVSAVPDVLSQGGGRELGPWPRRMAAAAVLALVVAAIVYSLPKSRHAAAHPAVTASALPRPLPLPPAVSGAVSGDAAVAYEPDGITGQVLSWPRDLRVPAAGDRPGWFWPATGQVVAITGLPSQRSGYQFTRVAGGWAVQANPAVPAICASCAGPQRPVYFLANDRQSATRVGLADAVAPGTTGTLWLTSYPSGAGPGTAVGTAREVNVAGRQLGPQLRLPAGYLIAQGTARGLLLAPLSEQAGTTADKLWDPGAAQLGRTFDGVIAASASQIAWAPPCAARCRVQVLDLATGRQQQAVLPAASSVASAAFSADGSFLALQVSFSDNADDGQLAVQLESLSLASDRLTAVPQTWVSSDALIGFGWAAGDDTLVAELSFTTKMQLAAWHPGARQLAIAALTPQKDPISPVIGQYAP